jgi:hypothetical protein
MTGAVFMDERYETFDVRPKAVVFRYYNDGSYEEFWELPSGTLRMNRYVAHAQSDGLSRVIVNTVRVPPGPIPPLPEPWT